jgi:hypothetical protein
MQFQFPISSPYPFERNKGIGCGSFYYGHTPDDVWDNLFQRFWLNFPLDGCLLNYPLDDNY